MSVINKTDLAISQSDGEEASAATPTKPVDVARAFRALGGGRKKGTPNKPKPPAEIAEACGWEPISWMVNLVKTGAILEDDGRKTEVPLDERLKMAREVTVYLVRKAPVVVHGEIDHRHAHIDVTHLMMNPAAAEAAETLALAMLDSPVQDAEFEDVLPPDKA